MTSDNELTNWRNKEISTLEKIALKFMFAESYDIINTYLDILYAKKKLTVANIKTETLLNELIDETYISVSNMINTRNEFKLFYYGGNLVYRRITVACWYVEKVRDEDDKDWYLGSVNEIERIFLQIYLYRNKDYIRRYIIKKATYNLRHL
jgi:hypothetical protein